MALTGSTGGGFDPIPADQYVARCVRVVDMGSEHNERWNKTQRKVQIMFEIPALIISEGEYAGMPRCISEWFTLSMAPKSHLRPKIESWRGQGFSDAEAEGFDILTLVGHPAIINVIHNINNGNTYANIASITPLMKGMECPEPKTEMYGFALTKSDFSPETFDKLSDKMKERIQKTPEYKELMGQPNNVEGYDPAQSGPGGFDPNDDVPF